MRTGPRAAPPTQFIRPDNPRIIPAMNKKKIVIIGLVGSVVDAGSGPSRWQRWRPTVSLCRHKEDLPVARFELIYQKKFEKLTQQVTALHDFARRYPFNPEKENYLIHITTGTHVAQICLFLLTEAHYFPAKLIQSTPPVAGDRP